MCCTHLQHRVGELHNEAAPVKFSFMIALAHYGAAIGDECLETIRCEPNESEILTKQTVVCKIAQMWRARPEHTSRLLTEFLIQKFFKVFVPLPLLQCCL